METDLNSLEDQLAAAIAARDGALRELDSLRARVASADAIHKRSNQRESELQKTIEALTAAELNLKAARTAESQTLARATAAEAALSRGGSGNTGSPDADLTPALQKQLGESRRLESAATAEAADLRAKLAEARAQVTAVASDSALAAVRESSSKAQAELHAVLAQNGALRRELDNSRARVTQLEAAAVTLHAQRSGPPPELAEARAAADKARHAQRSAEGTMERLRRDFATANTRITGLESTLAATRAASAANISAGAELAAAKNSPTASAQTSSPSPKKTAASNRTSPAALPRPKRERENPQEGNATPSEPPVEPAEPAPQTISPAELPPNSPAGSADSIESEPAPELPSPKVPAQ